MNGLTISHVAVVAITWLLVIFTYSLGEIGEDFDNVTIVDLGESALTE